MKPVLVLMYAVPPKPLRPVRTGAYHRERISSGGLCEGERQ